MKSPPHVVGRVFHANCLLVMISLFLRGRVRKIFRRKGHFMGRTVRGNCIHFKAVDTNLPWYRQMCFAGQIQVRRWVWNDRLVAPQGRQDVFVLGG